MNKLPVCCYIILSICTFTFALSGCGFGLLNSHSHSYYEDVVAYKTYDNHPNDVNFSGGNGTKSSPYMISSANDLRNLSRMMRPGNRKMAYANAYYIQTEDIDLGGMIWVPIGFYDEHKDFDRIGEDAFSGSYDGQGHEIRNMRINIQEFSYAGAFTHSNAQGLFGAISHQENPDAGLRNLILKDASIVYTDSDMPWHQSMCGGLVGFIYSSNVSIENCTVEDIQLNTSADRTGMIVGENNGKISNSAANGKIDYTVFDGYPRIGGALGTNTGYVNGCRTNCEITLTVNPVTTDEIEVWVGGFVGGNGSDEPEPGRSGIHRSSASGNLKRLNKEEISLYAGGFAGESWRNTPISICTATFNAADNGKEYPLVGMRKSIA